MRDNPTPLPSKEALEEMFEYKDGDLYWKKCGRASCVGKKVGVKNNRGYIITKINKAVISLHRLIYQLHYGDLSKEEIDHIDGNRQNNRIENLRKVTMKQQRMNTKVRADSTTGYKGIISDRRRGTYRVVINSTYLCEFKDLELAALVAEEAYRKLHGDYNCARTN